MVTAQVTIQMEKEGGVYKVPCTVNGVKMKFIFDTGAATVSMSQTMAQFLLDGEYLSESDIKGTGKSVLADGSIVNHATINLRDVEIGGMHIHNVEATVIEGQNAPLLLGQTAIGELGRVTIDGDRLVIHAAGIKLTQKQIDQLEEQIDRYYESESWAAAIESLLKLEAADGLSKNRLLDLCWCYGINQQYNECIQSCNRWLREYETTSVGGDKEKVYGHMAISYYNLDDYNTALLWFQKDLDIMENCDLSNYYNSVYFESKLDKKSIANTCYFIGVCYDEIGMSFQAVPYYKKAIKLQCQYLGVTLDDVNNGKVHDDNYLGLYLYNYALCYFKQNEEVDGDEVMRLAAICGNKFAIEFCRKYNMNYQTKSCKLFE